MPVSTLYDPRKLRSRAALRDALLALLEEEPLEAISIRDVVRQAGVGSATFYRHYETKADLLEDLAAREMEALIDVAIPVTLANGSREANTVLCRYVEQHKTLWNALFTGGAAGAMRVAFQNHLRQRRPPEMEHSAIPEDLRLTVSAASLIEVLSWWLKDGQAYSAEEAAEFLRFMLPSPGERTPETSRPGGASGGRLSGDR